MGLNINQSRYIIIYVQNQEIHILRQGWLMRQTKMEGYMKANGGSKYTHLTIYCHSSNHSRRSTTDAIGICNSFKQYFCGAGGVPW